MPNDGGHLLLSTEERDALLTVEPKAKQWIRRFLGADEFINNIDRWCLWLQACPAAELKAMPEVMKRIASVSANRKNSKRPATNKLAAAPHLFGEIRQPTQHYIGIPKTSSETREYIPIAILPPEVIASSELFTVSGSGLYEFGVLNSRMHMAWVRYTCGRMKSDYRYSAGVVYNNFPWPDLDKKSAIAIVIRAWTAIESAAQAVLDARATESGATLADLYNPPMPEKLLKAHRALDAAVDAAYALGGAKKNWKSDAERVAYLFTLYQQLSSL
jgi:hypothetical protein